MWRVLEGTSFENSLALRLQSPTLVQASMVSPTWRRCAAESLRAEFFPRSSRLRSLQLNSNFRLIGVAVSQGTSWILQV